MRERAADGRQAGRHGRNGSVREIPIPMIRTPSHTPPLFPRFPGRLTCARRDTIIVVADVSFLVLPRRQRPRRNRLAAITGVRWAFTASTRRLAPRRIRERAKGTTQDGPPTRTTRDGAQTRSTKEGIAQKR